MEQADRKTTGQTSGALLDGRDRAKRQNYSHALFLGACDWYAAEYDPKEKIFFGFVILNGDLECAEWGNFSFDELVPLRVSFMEVDRDRHWTPRPAREIKKIAQAQRWQFYPEVTR